MPHAGKLSNFSLLLYIFDFLILFYGLEKLGENYEVLVIGFLLKNRGVAHLSLFLLLFCFIMRGDMVDSGLNDKGGKRGLDASVGGLVWVQRRNGCWWPGQIVGLDDLSENGDDEPLRSGTPIKLLGRDDSDIEWYDLQTTKIVKAFRCGEYDACIEKAKLTAAKFLRRTLRYPRREIAIYCALEIEKAGKDGSNPSDNLDNEDLAKCENGSSCFSRSAKDDESSSKETSSDYIASACEENSNSTHFGQSYKETNGFTCLKRQPFIQKKRKTPNDSEDESNEGFKRMKGLNDLGIGSEQNVSVLALANTAPRSRILLNGTHSTNSTAVASLVNGGSVSTLKKVRSHVVHVHELMKRKYSWRPITKVLEKTTMVPVQIICDESANPFERSDAVYPAYESEDIDKVKDAELLNRHLPDVHSSDALFDVPFSDVELHLSGFTPVWQPSFTLQACVSSLKAKSTDKYRVLKPSVEHTEFDEPCPSYCTAGGSLNIEKSGSKWQLKRKRMARFISKNGHEISDAYATSLESPSQISSSSNGFLDGFANLRKHMLVSPSSQRSFSYHQPHFLVHSSSELPDILSLYEVEVTVEATRHQAQHVRYISLMSKLSGKPITGHPLTVEALEDGFCDLQTLDYAAGGRCEVVDANAEMDFIMPPKERKTNTKRIKLRRNKSSQRKGKSFKSRKRRGSSSKKTKKLSSLQGIGKRKPVVQSPNSPTVSCVPLKVVFSRIIEALNGSSRTTAHQGLT